MEYKIITEERFEEVLQYIFDNYFAEEPISKSVGIHKDGERNLALENYIKEVLPKKLSIMAVNENDEIVGLRLNDVIQRDYMDKTKKLIEHLADEKSKKLFCVCHELDKRAKLFDKFNVNKIFDLVLLSVDRRYRGKGIGREMIARTEKLARDLGFKVMKVMVTGIYSENILKSFGFTTLEEIFYDKWCDELGNQILKVESPHVKIQLLYKELN